MASDGPRHTPFSAVYLLLCDNDQVLLLKRKNTGRRDGEYSLVAGHIEEGEPATEAMVREANEEVGIELERSSLDPVHVIHRNSESRVYLDIFFAVHEWNGPVENKEPDKCAELAWYSRSQLPENTVPYVEQAITKMGQQRLQRVRLVDSQHDSRIRFRYFNKPPGTSQ